MTARAAISPTKSIYDGQQCIGFVLDRGKTGVEAFDRELRSLGVFETTAEAAGMVSDAAQNEEGTG
jgi:hypothetical protein